MAEETQGVKITRPGVRYYFDDAMQTCPMCCSNALEYRCRVRGTPRTAAFKCTACQCKFEKTRTVETEPEGYTPACRGVRNVLGISCTACGTPVKMPLDNFENASCVKCADCGTIIKDRIGQQA